MNKQQKQQLYDLLGDNIRRHRTLKGLTQEQLATKIDLARTSIVNIEQGRQHPPLHLLFEISRVLEVSFENLIPLESDFMSNVLLDAKILKDVSTKDIDKVTSFFKEFMKSTESHE